MRVVCPAREPAPAPYRRPRWASLLVAGVVVATSLLAHVTRAGAHDGCEPYPVSEHSPTGIVGCVVYGTGTASRWPGPGVARNDCTWPWDACQAIAIRSLTTGLTIVVTPTMYCDCYTGTPDERIVDLEPAAVAALGLDPAAGLYPVEVWPVDPTTGIEQAGSPRLESVRGGSASAEDADPATGAEPPVVLPDTAAGDA